MKNSIRISVVLVLFVSVLACSGKKGPSAEDRKAKTFLADNPVELSEQVKGIMEIEAATPGAHTESDFVVNIKLKMKKDIDWDNIYIWGDTLEGESRSPGKGDQKKVPGPKAAGETFEITIRMDRDGFEGGRVFLINSVTARGKFE